ncbi:MAG: hypothetical protein CMK89_18155 [Pseudomonadales bacterium]|nr:hypothetical protein [Pseudomonadales bacterium]
MKHISALPLLNTKKDWLVVGKGPSFSNLTAEILSSHTSVALNHAIKETKCDIAHAIDLDVVEDCAQAILQNSKYLILPLHPHIDFVASEKSLHELIKEIPVLQYLSETDRLFWYNSSTWDNPDNEHPVVPVWFFSADAVIALLAYNGIKKIRTIGIDGGQSYADSFKPFETKTLLKNGQPNFNCQFRAIAKTLKQTGVELMPIGMNEPIWIFVGSQQEQMIAVGVLEYSIMKHCKASVRVVPLHKNSIDYNYPKDPKNQPRTPFSFQRFLIPELKRFKGKAIYLDSDMQVFQDIHDLWQRDFGTANVLSAWLQESSERIPQFSVMLLDCDKLDWRIENIISGLDNGEYSYEELMHQMCVAVVDPSLEPEWNSLEFYETGKTKLLHYTDMETQPWLSTKNPLSKIWVNELSDAITDGFLSMDTIVESILAEEIRPSLYFELTRKKHNKVVIKLFKKYSDAGFLPPHRRQNAKKKKSLAKKIAHKLICSAIIKLHSKTNDSQQNLTSSPIKIHANAEPTPKR